MSYRVSKSHGVNVTKAIVSTITTLQNAGQVLSMSSTGKPTLRCSLLSLFIEPKKKQGTGQIDPHLSRTVRLHGQRLVFLSKQDEEMLQM